jgi:hypothetical protein
MNEDELRALVRTAIARVQGSATVMRPAAPSLVGGRVFLDPADRHASHGLFLMPDGSDAGGPCIIEPTVMCNHCGYCKSMGH